MRIIFTGLLFTSLSLQVSLAQPRCSSVIYNQQQSAADPSIKARMEKIEEFTRQYLSATAAGNARTLSIPQVIRIPVVFHIVYHRPEENISRQKIEEQLQALNRDFRRRNADTSQTPIAFQPLAADMEIEFMLAKSDPAGRGTSGIVRKYTPVRGWLSDDKVKSGEAYGADGWDSKNYLNIWVCNLLGDLGYSTFPGGELKKDGIVLNYQIVGNSGAFSQYGLGRSGVHEVGHWLNLRHIWGDAFCGDDLVSDTPKQNSYTSGCPTGTRITCSNTAAGDMYMNYMDFTHDACMNLFTSGQKQRARVLFEPGGPRHSILSSKAFDDPVIAEAPLPEFHPQWLFANIFPNPATTQLTVYLEYDPRWLGKELLVFDVNGRLVMKQIIREQIVKLDITKLSPGIFFIRAKSQDENLSLKFIKL